MKNSLIKKIVVSGAVVVGMFAFGGVMPASASTVTPNNGHFASRTVTYHINSSSKHWQKVWKKAIHKFGHNGTIKLKATTKKKAQLTLTTVAKFKNHGTWDASWSDDDATGVRTSARLRLSRKDCNEKLYIAKINTIVYGESRYPVEAIAAGVGLDHSTKNKGSLMNDNEWHSNLTKGDKLGLAEAYANVK
ncbi:hypothetical protein [Levilactobacillus acidifarinae]|uniref:Surface layer protein A domain-containing protein n=1 Tax=Levilactobacillus acidifarinae DSM 19394 = JCM 15949 TaxID=1423715 RepID=A0A0R1LIC2_9LACO|nr:hypothetical protein [Levilactobacillus acidifarinae]KRK95535.1 hypothetical protein FD25_GL000918 [Levilactobacillus acidifarinae DSM 19394]GEO70220.1 hypothetical protein LAC03_21300 [Levilactobacillus acidifarinae]